jgi:protein-tyrosine-phosphatase
MQILTICKFNRFRSKIAQHLLKEKYPQHTVISAGLIKGRPLDSNLISFYTENGITFTKKRSALSEKLIKDSDILIIVANDVPKDIFLSGRVFIGKMIYFINIEDTPSCNKAGMLSIYKSIKEQLKHEIYPKIQDK